MENKLNDEIKNIDKEISKINKEIKTEKNKANKDIDYYKKIINEKYNIIKEQLQIYKDKYGSNLDIYNRLINSINNTIKRSHAKQPLIIINNNNNINNSNIFSYDMNNTINNNNNKENINNEIELKNKNSNKSIKELILFPNENFINSEFNEDLINNNNINKELFNIGFDISRIDKSPYEQNNKSKEINNISINNISINNQIENIHNKSMSIREQNIKKINERRKASKALSNVDSFYRSNKNPSFEILNKLNQIKNKNNSINTEIKDNKNKTFYHASISGNMSNKKVFKEKNKLKKNKTTNNTSFNTSNINNINNINCTSERRYDKYNKYYNNYYKKSNKLLTFNHSNNSSINKHKYQSYSFITNKSNIKVLDSNSLKKVKDSNFHNSITKKKLGLFSYNGEKEPNNYKINLNNTTNNSINFLNIRDMNKLSHTLQSLKDTITQRGKIPYQSSNFNNNQNNHKFLEKIKFLTKTTFCFYRQYNNNSHKYNPLIDISEEYICQPPYNFIKANIALNEIFNQININPINEELNQIQLNVIDIENTIVSSKIKLIIEVHRNYRKYKESSKFKSIEHFVEKEILKNPQLTGDEIEKCAKNKNFNFSILINGGRLIELIICSYEEFKQWINGLAFLIKNKKEIEQL